MTPAEKPWLLRLRPVDRAAFGALLALAVLGPSLVRLAGRELEPWLTTAVVWHQAGAGWPDRDGPAPDRPPGVLDPWGRPFRWAEVVVHVLSADACAPVQVHVARSDGRDPDDPYDDVEVDLRALTSAPAWKRAMVERPASFALVVVVWLAAAWWRSADRDGRPRPSRPRPSWARRRRRSPSPGR